jgi:hypothetical protein
MNLNNGMWDIYRIIMGSAILGACALCTGCGNFFAQKPVEYQTREYLNELREIKENPHVTNTLPKLYRQPPTIIEAEKGLKVFYFAQNNPVKDLSTVLKSQLGCKVDVNPATNQLIIDCKEKAQADQILAFLEEVDVPPIQINIDCLIIERFADVTTDWESDLLIENFLGEEITMEGEIPGASLREAKRATFGIDMGFWRNKGKPGHQFKAVVNALVSRGYLKILMNPTLETLNGKLAKISTRDNVPIEKIVSGKDNPYSITEYQWVEDSLEVTPHVYADSSIGLNTIIKLGSRSKPEGVVQTSIITERTIEVEENRLAPGESLIIGGLRKTEERAVIRGVPFFKDLPLIGILFGTKDFEEKSNEVIFILTPSISSYGRPHTEMVEEMKEKLSPAEYNFDIQKLFTDPLGVDAYTEKVEEEAAQARFDRFKTELEKAQAEGQVEAVKEKLLAAAEEILAEKSRASEAAAHALTVKKELEKTKKEVVKAQKGEQAAKQATQKVRAEADKSKAEAQKAKKELENAKKQAEQKAVPKKPAPKSTKPAPVKTPAAKPTEKPAAQTPANTKNTASEPVKSTKSN